MPVTPSKAALGGEVVQGDKPLVNEKPIPPNDLKEGSLEQDAVKLSVEVGRLQGQNALLLDEVSQAKRQLAKEQERANDLEMKVQKGGFSDGSRKFRIFLAIIEGFVSRGVLDPEKLAQSAKAGAKTPEDPILNHAAGLAERANQSAKSRDF